MVSDLRDDMVALRCDMNRRFEQVDQRFLHLEDKMDRRFDSIDAKLTKYFAWTAGMFVTTLIAILGSLGALVTGVLTPR